MYNNVFMNHHTPISSSADLNLHLCHCTFISCFSENGVGAIKWTSQESDIFMNNIVAKACWSKNYINFAYLRANVISVAIISITNSRNGSHTISLGSNSLVLDSNISQCQSKFETLQFQFNQAEVRLCKIDSCYANVFIILGFLSVYNRCSFIELKNCTSSSSEYGALKTNNDLFLYKSNFIDNIGNVILYVEGKYNITAVDCYFKDTGQRSCNGNLNIISESNLIKVPIFGANGYQKRSQKNVLKFPISVLHFALLISTVIVDLSLSSDAIKTT